MNAKCNIAVLTGFLGSGKTTLLRRMLTEPEFQDTAVIVNEFGEIGLDHVLLESGQEDVVLLDSGCLCCVVSDSLSDTLASLIFRRANGSIPPFKRVVIETSGLADPAPILHCLMTDKLIQDHFTAGELVCLVDAVHGAEYLMHTEEAIKQIAIADKLVLSKTDRVNRGEIETMREYLADLNPAAALHLGNKPTQCLFDWLSQPPLRALHDRFVQPLEAHRHGHSDITTESYVIQQTATWAGFDYWLRHLSQFPGAQLLRMKGVIAFGHKAQPHFVQGVQHVFGAPQLLPQWPWPDRCSRIVFITRGLSRDTLGASLACLGAAEGVQHLPVQSAL